MNVDTEPGNPMECQPAPRVHTVHYTVCAADGFASDVADDDACEGFRNILNRSIFESNDHFYLKAGYAVSEGDNRNEPRYEWEEVEEVEITHCPFCGARLVVGEDIVEDGDPDEDRQ